MKKKDLKEMPTEIAALRVVLVITSADISDWFFPGFPIHVHSEHFIVALKCKTAELIE